VERLSAEDAGRTLDLLVKYKGDVPARLWNEAVLERERAGSSLDSTSSLMTFTSDEMQLSPPEEDSAPTRRISTKVPQRVDWRRYTVGALAEMPPISFCNTLGVDSDLRIELESMVGKTRTPDAWRYQVQKTLQADYRAVDQLETGETIAYFQLDDRFVALLFSADGKLLNYFYLNALLNTL